jgi:hypothetical protein
MLQHGTGRQELADAAFVEASDAKMNEFPVSA